MGRYKYFLMNNSGAWEVIRYAVDDKGDLSERMTLSSDWSMESAFAKARNFGLQIGIELQQLEIVAQR
jgi:hypothetical protein